MLQDVQTLWFRIVLNNNTPNGLSAFIVWSMVNKQVH